MVGGGGGGAGVVVVVVGGGGHSLSLLALRLVWHGELKNFKIIINSCSISSNSDSSSNISKTACLAR